MVDVQFRLTDAKHQMEWILWLVARLDQRMKPGERLDNLGPDDGSNPPTLEEADCRTYPESGPLTIDHVARLAKAAKDNIELCLRQLGS